MLRSRTMSEPMRRESFPVCYGEAQKLILKHNDVDGAIGRLCRARPEDRNDSWLRTDLLAAALFARGRYRHCLSVLHAYNGRYPGDPRAQLAIQIVARKLVSVP